MSVIGWNLANIKVSSLPPIKFSIASLFCFMPPKIAHDSIVHLFETRLHEWHQEVIQARVTITRRLVLPMEIDPCPFDTHKRLEDLFLKVTCLPGELVRLTTAYVTSWTDIGIKVTLSVAPTELADEDYEYIRVRMEIRCSAAFSWAKSLAFVYRYDNDEFCGTDETELQGIPSTLGSHTWSYSDSQFTMKIPTWFHEGKSLDGCSMGRFWIWHPRQQAEPNVSEFLQDKFNQSWSCNSKLNEGRLIARALKEADKYIFLEEAEYYAGYFQMACFPVSAAPPLFALHKRFSEVSKQLQCSCPTVKISKC